MTESGTAPTHALSGPERYANKKLVDGMRAWSLLSSALVAVLGLLVLAGWWLDLEMLRNPHAGDIAVAPATGLCLAMLGFSLMASSGAPTPGRQRASIGLASLAGLLGLLVLAQYAAAWSMLDIEQLLYPGELGTFAGATSGRTAPNTALCLTLAAAAAFLMDLDLRGARESSQYLALLIGFLSLMSVAGYLYGVPGLYSLYIYTPMVPPTALALGMLSSALFCARPDAGLASILASDTAGGIAARRLLPPAIVVPFLVGALRLAGEYAGFYESALGATILVMTMILLLGLLIFWTAASLTDLDARRIDNEEKISQLNTSLAARVEQLSVLNEELRRLSDRAECARQQAQEASRLKSTFVANMSHEIRTPLNAVIGMTDILLATRLNSKQREYMDILQDAGRSLLAIINDILDFSKIEAGKLSLELVDFDPVRVVESVGELLAAQAHEKKLSLMTYVSPDVPQLLRGDPDRLRQILLNLVGNAIKFSDAGEVVVRTEAERTTGRRAVLTFQVIDQGIGMSPEEKARLFQPFVQADDATGRRFGGTGLGLSISKRLVEMMGGEISVVSARDAGSTFTVTLPFEAVEPAERLLADIRRLTGLKALVVDDQQHAREILESYLLSWDMRCHVARSAGEALSMLVQAREAGDPFRIALIDLLLNGKSGLDLVREVEEKLPEADLKYILVTACDQPGIGEQAIRLGFSGYLTKPVRQSQLFDCISNALCGGAPVRPQSRSRGAPRPELSAGAVPGERGRGEILVVEDNPINQKVTVLHLERLGYRAHVVANGREALGALERAAYDAVLMDCQMPEMDGFEAAASVRRAETRTGVHVPIVAMTAHAMQGDRERCIAAGMDDYISKPIDADRLGKVLSRWISAGQVQPDNSRHKDPQVKSEPDGGPASMDAQENLETPPLDVAVLQTNFGPDEARNLLKLFVEDMTATIDRIKAALADKNAEGLAVAAHYLRGTCSTIGASSMHALGTTLEEQARSEHWETAQATADDLAASFAQVQRYLKDEGQL